MAETGHSKHTIVDWTHMCHEAAHMLLVIDRKWLAQLNDLYKLMNRIFKDGENTTEVVYN